jgi:hypothetical protein
VGLQAAYSEVLEVDNFVDGLSPLLIIIIITNIYQFLSYVLITLRM